VEVDATALNGKLEVSAAQKTTDRFGDGTEKSAGISRGKEKNGKMMNRNHVFEEFPQFF
jgi:hypothetical protein